MKYFSRLQIYKASNVTFNPLTCQAHSYGWWKFVDRINGKVVFNNFRYSPSTSKHQYKVRRLLAELGIRIDLEISTKDSLDRYVGLNALASAYRRQDLASIPMIQQVFDVRLTNREIHAIYEAREEELCEKFLSQALKRQELKEKTVKVLKPEIHIPMSTIQIQELPSV